MNLYASALGKMGRGKKKKLTKLDVIGRTERLKKARAKRWKKH